MLKGRNNCFGCAACASVCPVDAIEMKKNNEYFFYPEIDSNKCIHCNKCEQVCNKLPAAKAFMKAYAIQLQNDDVLRQSTSGGAVTAIAKVIFQKKGVVCAATYSVLEGSQWLFIDKSDNLKSIRGSKYLQIALTKECYQLICSQLEFRPILFIGTPCQVDAIKNVVPQKLQDKLYTVDIICGGVVSDHIEQLYEKYLEKRNNKKVVERIFRGKQDGIWNRKYCSITQYEDNDQDIKMGSNDLYTRVYTSERALRESCYHCGYTTKERTGDITVGDCWGIEKAKPNFQNIEKGVSMLLINSEKGEEIFNLLNDVEWCELNIDEPLKMNKPLSFCTKRHWMRSYSYKIYNLLPFNLATNIVSYRYLLKRILRGKE